MTTRGPVGSVDAAVSAVTSRRIAQPVAHLGDQHGQQQIRTAPRWPAEPSARGGDPRSRPIVREFDLGFGSASGSGSGPTPVSVSVSVSEFAGSGRKSPDRGPGRRDPPSRATAWRTPESDRDRRPGGSARAPATRPRTAVERPRRPPGRSAGSGRSIDRSRASNWGGADLVGRVGPLPRGRLNEHVGRLVGRPGRTPGQTEQRHRGQGEDVRRGTGRPDAGLAQHLGSHVGTAQGTLPGHRGDGDADRRGAEQRPAAPIEPDRLGAHPAVPDLGPMKLGQCGRERQHHGDRLAHRQHPSATDQFDQSATARPGARQRQSGLVLDDVGNRQQVRVADGLDRVDDLPDLGLRLDRKDRERDVLDGPRVLRPPERR